MSVPRPENTTPVDYRETKAGRKALHEKAGIRTVSTQEVGFDAHPENGDLVLENTGPDGSTFLWTLPVAR